ncbi:MAG: aminotransferase class IV [Bradyrhizobiaceae bacterium]|nr:MAG: aminotransferase class IV [Bradyrhizobiaceae bacterium]
MPFVWCNGRLIAQSEARIAVSDRGFTLADGVFETLRAAGNRPLWFADHLARLRAGAECLGLSVPYDDSAIEAAVTSLLTNHGHAASAVRITLTRGPTSQRGLWSSDNPGYPTLLITAAAAGQLPPQHLVICRATRRNEYSPLSGIKSLNYGDNILARREAVAKGATDALMLNTKGEVACATVGNIFVRIGGRWLTPQLASGILPGLARAKIIPRIAASEIKLTEPDLVRADAAFISNSLGCTAIASLEGRPLQGSLPDLPIYE